MRTLFRILLLFLTALPISLGVAAYMGLQQQALVKGRAELTHSDVERAKRILKEHDPRKMKAATFRRISVSQRDVDLVVNYLASRYGSGASTVELEHGRLALKATVVLPQNPVGRFLNLDMALLETDGLPRFEYLRIGRLPVPGWLSDVLLKHALDTLYANGDHPRVTDVVKNVAVADNRLRVTYKWQADLVDRVKARLVKKEDQERLKVFHEHLVKVSHRVGPGSRTSLASFIQPLFKLAYQRSRKGNPVADNRAAIMVLATFINGLKLESIVPAAAEWPRPAQRPVTLHARKDLAQHFIVSAALAITGGGVFSDAIGLYKEIDDSRGGSGFSFIDLAADRAGTRFGELATGSPQSAQKVQKQLSQSLRETDFMPTVTDLPEFLSEKEFKKRFGGVNSPSYKRMTRRIEQRIAACALYRKTT